MELLVVGAGAMGRWFARVLRADGPEPVTIRFTDSDERVAEAAVEALGGSVTVDPEAGSADAVCIAVPIPAAADAIDAYADVPRQALIDITGTMTTPVEAMRASVPDCERISLHPLFAPANEPGNVPAVVEDAGPTWDAVTTALTVRGNEVFETTPSEHDNAMETVQARVHTTVFAYALAAESFDERFHTPISSELTALAEHVTDGDARVYADIQAAYDGAGDVAAAAERIATADAATLEALYAEAATAFAERGTAGPRSDEPAPDRSETGRSRDDGSSEAHE